MKLNRRDFLTGLLSLGAAVAAKALPGIDEPVPENPVTGTTVTLDVQIQDEVDGTILASARDSVHVDAPMTSASQFPQWMLDAFGQEEDYTFLYGETQSSDLAGLLTQEELGVLQKRKPIITGKFAEFEVRDRLCYRCQSEADWMHEYYGDDGRPVRRFTCYEHMGDSGAPEGRHVRAVNVDDPEMMEAYAEVGSLIGGDNFTFDMIHYGAPENWPLDEISLVQMTV